MNTENLILICVTAVVLSFFVAVFTDIKNIHELKMECYKTHTIPECEIIK